MTSESVVPFRTNEPTKIISNKNDIQIPYKIHASIKTARYHTFVVVQKYKQRLILKYCKSLKQVIPPDRAIFGKRNQGVPSLESMIVYLH